MSSGCKRMEAYLMDGGLAVRNAINDPDLREVLLPYQYDEERLTTGLELQERTYRLFREQVRSYADQYRAREKLKKILKVAKAAFTSNRQLARAALTGRPDLLTGLGLGEETGQGIGDWLESARLFYINSLGDKEILKILSEVGLTRAMLKAGNVLADKVEKASAAHQAAKSKAIHATEKRNESFKEFKTWMKKFRRICRVAFADSPQKLEKMGTKVKS